MSALAAKLGWKAGRHGAAFGCPEELCEALAVLNADPDGADILVGFAAKLADVDALARTMVPHYRRGGWLWIAYPKRSGRLASDISRDTGWTPLVEHDLLPVTQVALDADWSALRFRYRDEIKSLTRQTDVP